MNTTGAPLEGANWWVALYDAAGSLINVGWGLDTFYEVPLASGAAAPFEVTIQSDEPVCFATFRVRGRRVVAAAESAGPARRRIRGR